MNVRNKKIAIKHKNLHKSIKNHQDHLSAEVPGNFAMFAPWIPAIVGGYHHNVRGLNSVLKQI